MTTETVLTDAQIFDCFDRQCAEMVISFDADELYPVGRAIEQAVLRSPEVQAWKGMAGEYEAMIQHIHCGGDALEFLSKRAAMEKQP